MVEAALGDAVKEGKVRGGVLLCCRFSGNSQLTFSNEKAVADAQKFYEVRRSVEGSLERYVHGWCYCENGSVTDQDRKTK